MHGANCLFVLDEHGATEHELDHSSPPALPLLRVSAARPPAHCCPARRRRRLKQAAGGAADPHAHLFFCEPHRAVTLPAQYRFLPALQHVAASPAFTGGKFRFVVLVDDDSYVFVRRLLWLLSRIDHKRPLYLGDFGASPEAILLGVKRFACGGGGSVLTAGALRRMDLAACTRRYHAMCMQSDWMIGGCAMSYNVTALGELGCNTCDQRYNAGRVKAMLKADRCFFSQIAEKYAADLPLGARARHFAQDWRRQGHRGLLPKERRAREPQPLRSRVLDFDFCNKHTIACQRQSLHTSGPSRGPTSAAALYRASSSCSAGDHAR